ncbi:polyhydroxyalkanoate depolymerase [Pseudooceanicola sp. 216_PA32_1]|uniref:Polyhydroxyalkanoate depolymerase n=1 Tax=Pseudooceanicola pacificus TaxID=2676438 RepID=A0A844W8T5_9RHOB|nr:polyhydroxyalkanoate depolymerase [Pseudooceanicola pacificus]MWB76888.1 polyhydroxyalkanoate depolymerase [Pseudooceanicola pacificus]
MLYHMYQLQDDMIAPMRFAAGMTRMGSLPGASLLNGAVHKFDALMTMIERFQLTHERPDFCITRVKSGNRMVDVVDEVALDLPFGQLLHFTKPEVDVPQPKVLVVAPLSGHFATLLRGTVEVLLQDHDVYITDWKNARDVPVSAGYFGVEDYVEYLIRFMEEIGPGGNILAVCQPCVQALIAVSVMSQQDHPCTPRTMTLMAGPIDVRESPTVVNDLAFDHPIGWFERNVISTVPWRFAGGGRKVYPGFVQLFAFMNMNMDRHKAQHKKLYDLLAEGKEDEAQKIMEFYDEYFAVLDLTAEFYLETIERIFQKAELAKGEFTYRGELVDPSAIRKTALLTVEGGRDDICSLGQTTAAHDLCSSLRPHLKRHHLQANVGHYGVFNGKRWEFEIYPVVRNMILAME